MSSFRKKEREFGTKPKRNLFFLTLMIIKIARKAAKKINTLKRNKGKKSFKSGRSKVKCLFKKRAKLKTKTTSVDPDYCSRKEGNMEIVNRAIKTVATINMINPAV